MEASNEEERGAATHHKVKKPKLLSDGVILLHDKARIHTANLMRNKLQRFGRETFQHPPYSPDLSPCDFNIFGDLKKEIHGRRVASVSFGRGNARVGEVVDPSATYLFLQDELIISSPSGINVSTLLAITFDNKFHCHFVVSVRFSFDCTS